MIKLNSQGTAPDYTEYGSVTTDCRTVGEFMTQAAAIYGVGLTIKVGGFRYEFFDNPKIRVTDDTPIDEISYASAPGSVTFIVNTKPKPKTVKKSGWIQLYKDSRRYFAGYVRENKEDFSKEIGYNCEKVAAVKIEWEEVAE